MAGSTRGAIPQTPGQQQQKNSRESLTKSWTKKAYASFAESELNSQGLPRWVRYTDADMAKYNEERQAELAAGANGDAAVAALSSADLSDTKKLLTPGLYTKMPGETGYMNVVKTANGYQVEEYPPSEPTLRFRRLPSLLPQNLPLPQLGRVRVDKTLSVGGFKIPGTNKRLPKVPLIDQGVATFALAAVLNPPLMVAAMPFMPLLLTMDYGPYLAAKEREFQFMKTQLGLDTIVIKFPEKGQWVDADKVMRLMQAAERNGMAVELDGRVDKFIHDHDHSKWLAIRKSLEKLEENKARREVLMNTDSTKNLQDMRVVLDHQEKIQSLVKEELREEEKDRLRNAISGDKEGEEKLSAIEEKLAAHKKELLAGGQSDTQQKTMAEELIVMKEQLADFANDVERKNILEQLGGQLEERQALVDEYEKAYQEAKTALEDQKAKLPVGSDTKEIEKKIDELEEKHNKNHERLSRLQDKKRLVGQPGKENEISDLDKKIKQLETELFKDRREQLFAEKLEEKEARVEGLKDALKDMDEALEVIEDKDVKDELKYAQKKVEENGGEERLEAAQKELKETEHKLVYGDLVQSVLGGKAGEERLQAIENDLQANVEARIENIEGITGRMEVIQNGFDSLLREKVKVKDIAGVETGQTQLGGTLSPEELAKKLSDPEPIKELRTWKQWFVDKLFQRSEGLKDVVAAADEASQRFEATKTEMSEVLRAKSEEAKDLQRRQQAWAHELNKDKTTLMEEKKALISQQSRAVGSDQKEKIAQDLSEVDEKLKKVDTLLGKIKSFDKRLKQDEKESQKILQRNDEEIAPRIESIKKAAIDQKNMTSPTLGAK